MYSYKKNNSNTIYVSYAYINECIKASRNYVSAKPSSETTSNPKPTPLKAGKKVPNKVSSVNKTKTKSTEVVKPLPNNTPVRHKTFGDGVIISSENNTYINVQFGDETRKFLYPQAFEEGYLTRI